MTAIIELPWPSPKLSPNAASPGSWRIKQTAAKKYKAECLIACRASMLPHYDFEKKRSVHLTYKVHASDRRRYDLDNFLAKLKWATDAISETIGVDDSLFGFTIIRGEPIKGGLIQCTITQE